MELSGSEPQFIQPSKKKKSKLFRIIKWTGISFFSFIALLILAAWIIVYFFEDDIKKYAIEQINKEVNTKIEVKDIHLSLFKKFPLASLEFTGVKCHETGDSTSTENLLEAKSVFLEFSVWDIFKGKYRFKKLSVENGKIDMEIDKKGRPNFDIIKKKEKSAKSGPAGSFEFNEFTLKNIHFSFLDEQAHNEYRVQVKKLNCSGSFTEKEFTLKSKASLFSEVISVDHEDYITNRNIFFQTSIKVNTQQKSCTIKSANLELEGMKLAVAGMFKYDSTTYAALEFKGENLDIQSFLSLLPSSQKRFENKYKSEGNFYLNGSIKGNLNNPYSTHIQANFGIKKGTIRFVEEDVKMKDIYFEGSFNSGSQNSPETAEIHIKSFSAKMEQSSVSGNFHLKNLEQPSLKFQLNADADLAELLRFIPIDKVESISGRVKADLSYEGSLSGNTFSIEDYKSSKTNGRVSLQDVTLKLKKEKVGLSACSGDILFENTIGTVPSFSGKIANTDFKLSGKVENLPEYYLLDNAVLKINASVFCNQVILEDFMKEAEPTKNSKKLTFDIPSNIYLNLNADMNEFSFKKFSATQIKGRIIIHEKKLFAEDLSFSSCGGTAFISGSINTQDPENITTQAIGSFKKINISDLFTAFDNFSQTTLEDKNVKGVTTASIAYSAAFTHNLEMKMNTLFVNAPLEIQNGELIDFKPLESLSKFIRLEELRDIKFSTLTNTIEIKDEAIIIPKMSIQSSALNIEIGGIHHFDDRIEYYFNVYLKDLLAAKWKKKKKTEDEFGEIIEEEGGARLYLKMTGTMDDPKIGIDKKGVKEKIKDDMKKEGQNFKQMFYEEFGVFKNDTTLKKSTLTPPKKENKNKVKNSEEIEFE